MPRRVAVASASNTPTPAAALPSSPSAKPQTRRTIIHPQPPKRLPDNHGTAQSHATANAHATHHPKTHQSISSSSSPPLTTKLHTNTKTTIQKKITRPPKYHETKSFLAAESAVLPCHPAIDDDALPPWHLGYRASESYRLTATMHRAMAQAALHVRPVSWGYGTQDGTLGHNNAQHTVHVLKRMAAFRHEYVCQVAAGNKLSVFLTSAGKVLQCGRLFLRQDGTAMWRPREVSFTQQPENNESPEKEDGTEAKLEVACQDEPPARIESVAAGHLAAYAVDDCGRIFSWGTKRYGQLGHGDDHGDCITTDGKAASNEELQRSNQADSGNDEEQDEDEDDDNSDKEPELSLGRPADHSVELRPRLISDPVVDGIRFVKLSAGNHFVLALSTCGRVFSWGCNTHGQLGLGTDDMADDFSPLPRHGDGTGDRHGSLPIVVGSPYPIQHALQSCIALDVAAGHSHSLVVAMPRTQQDAAQFATYTMVFACGRGTRGRLGIGGEDDQWEPVEVSYFRGLHATRVAAGHDHSLVLCGVGARSYVYSFGGNTYGQLGVAQQVPFSDMPLAVDELSGTSVATVCAGAYASAALSGDGRVYTWGDGTHGKTARPDGRTTFVPWQVTTTSTGADSAAATTTTKSIQSSRVVCLGDDGFVTQLAMGAHHSLALYRVHGTPDRWRKFPLAGSSSTTSTSIVAPYLHEQDDHSQQRIVCGSAHSSATATVFGIALYCETCHGLGPLCRVCVRRCHVRHKLVPRRHESSANTIDNNTGSLRCACGERRPPLAVMPLPRKEIASSPPVTVAPHKAQPPSRSSISINTSSDTTKHDVSAHVPTTDNDDADDNTRLSVPSFCAMAQLPTLVPE